ncbi:RING/U-box superfamily protein [Striga asiatica]|uniref:RING/U-box superfamily protein n=1 Tax=Striga asiatica TaxID=4170 RepID=A0A5A7PKI1_STRAF|nr:RING/U-box superfamily protein [Striga asiatica]
MLERPEMSTPVQIWGKSCYWKLQGIDEEKTGSGKGFSSVSPKSKRVGPTLDHDGMKNLLLHSITKKNALPFILFMQVAESIMIGANSLLVGSKRLLVEFSQPAVARLGNLRETIGFAIWAWLATAQDDLAVAHKHCADTWFKIRGNKPNVVDHPYLIINSKSTTMIRIL